MASSINDESRNRGRNPSTGRRETHSRYDSMAQALLSYAWSCRRAGLALPPVLSPAFCRAAADNSKPRRLGAQGP